MFYFASNHPLGQKRFLVLMIDTIVMIRGDATLIYRGILAAITELAQKFLGGATLIYRGILA
jgi:hypothetical protein